jgi:putative phage-type endonuclease
MLTTEKRESMEENRHEWLMERKKFLGASEIGAIVTDTKYGCPLKVYFSKKDVEPDFDDSNKDVFRRGRRLESVASCYYLEKTQRNLKATAPITHKEYPFLRVSPDRLVQKESGGTWAYLEIKVVGRGSLYNIKKNGLPPEYIIQMQAGLAFANLDWGSYCVYCPETDDLLYWDLEADKELGAHIIEKGVDFWNFHIEADCPPDPLPVGSKQCKECPYFKSCPNSKVEAQEASSEEVSRNDLESVGEMLVRVREEKKLLEEEEDRLKNKILEEIKSIPGSYRCGKYLARYTQTESERFDSKALKAHDEILWKKFTKVTVSNVLKLGE